MASAIASGDGHERVDVVIPTFDRRDLVATCLDSLRGQTFPHRTVVVDNGSKDGTAELVASDYPEASLLAMGANLGFARAVNAGIRAGGSEVVVVLNNDVTLHERCLELLAERLLSDPGVAMVAPVLLRRDSASIDSAGLEVDPTLAPFPRAWGQPPDSRVGEEGLLGPTGAAAAYRRRALEDVGCFDERIFAYSEDTDLALRLRAGGWMGAVAGDARGVHFGSASFGPHSPWQVYRRGWSRGYMLRKYGVMRRPSRALRVAAGDGMSVAWQLLATRKTGGLRGRVAGWRAGKPTHAVPDHAVNYGISLRDAIARRRSFRG